MQFTLPSSNEIRTIIEAIPEETITVQVGEWGIPIDGRKVKYGFMAQYLWAGRISEVFGKYGPIGRYAFHVKVDGLEAALFCIKTAKRKTKRGWTLRPALTPLDPEYEPWSKPLLDYMKNSREKNPFKLAELNATSVRYAQAAAVTYFTGLQWRFVNYKRKINKEKIEVPDRWKPFTSHELRKRRAQDLELYYRFDTIDLRYYGGWENNRDRVSSSDSMRHYLELDLDESPENVRILIKLAQRYFPKLLVPIKNVLNPEEANLGGIEILS